MPAFVQFVRRQWWRLLLLVILPVVVFWPARHGDFILDDNLSITDCDVVRLPDGLYRIWFTTDQADYYPVTNSSFWLEWHFWGMNTLGYHCTNIVLHIATCILLWLVLERLAIPGAFLAAVIFAVHPVNVESVAWIVQRKNLLALLFGLLTTLWYLKSECRLVAAGKADGEKLRISQAESSTAKWYWLSVVAFLLAMLSKGSVAVLPLLVLWITWWKRPVEKRDFWRIAPLLAIAIVFTLVNIWWQARDHEVAQLDTLAQRFLRAGAVVWFYLYKAVLPIQLSFVYPRWNIQVNSVIWWLPLAACVIVAAVLWRLRQIAWMRAVLCAWGFFCIALLPVMGFVDVGYMKYSLVADHYQHFALIAVVTLVAAGVAYGKASLIRGGRAAAGKVVSGVAMAVVGLLCGLTWMQSSLYAKAVDLYEDTLQKNPDSWLANANLAGAELTAGDAEKSILHARRAIELDPNDAEGYLSLATGLMHQGKTAEAIEAFKKSLEIRGDFPMAHNNLGAAYASEGRMEKAIAEYQKALELRPDYFDAQNNLGLALAKIGRAAEAIDHYRQALLAAPDDADIYENLGKALEAMGRHREAIEKYTQSLRLQPGSPKVLNDLGLALLHAGEFSAARDQFEAALKANPNQAMAEVNLGIAMCKSGEFLPAIEHFQRALKIHPELIQAELNMAVAYAELKQANEAKAAGMQALEWARAQQQPEMAAQIEAWLKNLPAVGKP